ncbi:MAG: tetratricopeptide repeat protein [Rudaea sp.]|nr:tetratricopeptide repeat protein [Rudaea sp.]
MNNLPASGSAALERARIALASADFPNAFASATDALAAEPNSIEARVLRLNAALKLERWQDAIPDLEKLIAAQPHQTKLRRGLAVCWLRIGNAFKAQGDSASSEQSYRKAVDEDPRNFDALYNLGSLILESGRAAEAAPLLQQVVDAVPDDLTAAIRLAEADVAIGQDGHATTLLTRVAAQSPGRERLQRCCELLVQAGSLEAAKTLARDLIPDQPSTAPWARQFCRQLRTGGDLEGSRNLLDLLRRQTTDSSELLRIDLADALGLPSLYADRNHLDAVRADFLARLDRFVDTYTPQHLAARLPTPDALSWDNFYLAYQGENDRVPQTRFGEWLARSMPVVAPVFAVPRSRTSVPRPRVAIVSSRLHECTVGSYFASWIEWLGNGDWELILVHVGSFRDQVTERLARSADGELTLDGTTAENADKLHALRADLILYPELGMDYRTLALAAQRLAPCQACAWGHPVTSGLPTIDTFISCAEMEPPDATDHYCEQLLTLPGIGTRYLSPRIPVAGSRAELGLPARGTLYLVPQSLFKLHPDNDNVFVDIAKNDPHARLVLFEGIDRGVLRIFRSRLSRTMQAAGMKIEDCVRFLPMRSRSDYLRINQACDVMLDSLHWSGGNTTLDALHSRLPVVTCPGRFMRGRQSMAMLQRIDCAELIADSPPQLAALAVNVANDHSRRKKINDRIDARLAGLAQSDKPLHILEKVLRQILA